MDHCVVGIALFCISALINICASANTAMHPSGNFLQCDKNEHHSVNFTCNVINVSQSETRLAKSVYFEVKYELSPQLGNTLTTVEVSICHNVSIKNMFMCNMPVLPGNISLSRVRSYAVSCVAHYTPVRHHRAGEIRGDENNKYKVKIGHCNQLNSRKTVQLVDERSDVNLKCLDDQSGNVKWSWTDTDGNFVGSDNVLSIRNATRSSAGTYTCYWTMFDIHTFYVTTVILQVRLFPNKPYDLKLSHIYSNGDPSMNLILSWKHDTTSQENTETPRTRYDMIYYQLDHSSNGQRAIAYEAKEFNISKLQEGAFYEFSVAARNEIGSSPTTKLVAFVPNENNEVAVHFHEAKEKLQRRMDNLRSMLDNIEAVFQQMTDYD